MYLLILCVLISWPVIIIFFMLFCSYHLQMAGGAVGQCIINGVPVTVTM